MEHYVQVVLEGMVHFLRVNSAAYFKLKCSYKHMSYSNSFQTYSYNVQAARKAMGHRAAVHCRSKNIKI